MVSPNYRLSSDGEENIVIALKKRNSVEVSDEERHRRDYECFQHLAEHDICMVEEAAAVPPRETWSNGLEFLMSCIGMSVGLGNIWMFPFRAYENGGGAFLVPYLVILVLVGKPMYFLELVLGQFSRKGPIKAYDFSPAMRGVGAGQTVAILIVMTFYSYVMAIILYYTGMSFSPTLPWNKCDERWSKVCYDSGETLNGTLDSNSSAKSSAQLYFTETVVHMKDDVHDGIGPLLPDLCVCLLVSWTVVFLVLLKGIKTSGKASYFVAVFPYVIMFVLLGKAFTLPGATEGMKYFITPNFTKITEPGVWYAAATQSFFSLNIGFGCTIMYSSFNGFRHDIYRDTLIITSLDTVASLLAGFTIFGILGYLQHVTGIKIKDMNNKGPGLAFQSYPEAISKFQEAPQLFGVLFFFMLFVLSIGSIVAMASSGITVIRDKFPKVKHWQAVSSVCLFGFLASLVYCTPGGIHLLDIANTYGAELVVLILGVGQFLAVCWIYGMRRFCDDIEYMLDRKVSLYWRVCWSTLSPMILILILIHTLLSIEPLSTKVYTITAIVFGWLLTVLGLIQIPAFAACALWKSRSLGCLEMIRDAFHPTQSWGPTDPQTKSGWLKFIEQKRISREECDRNKSEVRKFFDWILGY